MQETTMTVDLGGTQRSVCKKLQKARIKLQQEKLTKSGHNKFAGYDYFELGDFLPWINYIFDELGLCSIVSFGKELATLTIIDTDSGEEIVITSPMAEAQLKGCHPIQNLGAVETYSRRYLYVTALEIVEHDALDSAPPVDKPAIKEGVGVIKATDGAKESLTKEQVAKVNGIANSIVDLVTVENYDAAFAEIEGHELEVEEKIYLASFLNATQRRKVKEAGEKYRKSQSNTLNA